MSPKGLLLARIHPVSACPQPVQHVGGGESVGWNPDRGLKTAQRVPGLPAELAVRGAKVEAAVGEKLLQFQPLGPRQFPLLARPALHEGLSTPEAVGKMA